MYAGTVGPAPTEGEYLIGGTQIGMVDNPEFNFGARTGPMAAKWVALDGAVAFQGYTVFSDTGGIKGNTAASRSIYLEWASLELMDVLSVSWMTCSRARQC